MFKYLIAKCPVTGCERYPSDWWEVLTRHKDIDCAETELVKISQACKAKASYKIFKLHGYLVGQEFNIRRIKENE